MLHPGLMRGIISRIGREARLNADYWRGGVFVYATATGSRALIEEEVTQGWAGRIRASAQRGQAALLLKAFNLTESESRGRLPLGIG